MPCLCYPQKTPKQRFAQFGLCQWRRPRLHGRRAASWAPVFLQPAGISTRLTTGTRDRPPRRPGPLFIGPVLQRVILDALLRQQVAFGDFLTRHRLPFGTVAIETLILSHAGGLHLGFNHLLAAHKKKHPSVFISIYGISCVCLCRSAIPHATASGGNAGVWIRRRA